MVRIRTTELITLIVGILLFSTQVLGHGPLHQQIAQATEEISRDPQNARLYLKRAELYRLHQDWDLSLADYKHAASLDPTLVEVDLGIGKLMFESNRFDEARSALDRFLEKQPNDPEGLVTRARVLVRLGENLAAVEDYSKAIELLEMPSPSYYLERAKALISEGSSRIDEAIEGLDRGLATLGPVVTLQLFAIELEMQRKNYDGALRRLDLIARQSARKERWLVRRADILLQAGRPSEALRDLRAAQKALESLSAFKRKVKATAKLADRLRALMAKAKTMSNSEKSHGAQ